MNFAIWDMAYICQPVISYINELKSKESEVNGVK